jgi:hypothetical protein
MTSGATNKPLIMQIGPIMEDHDRTDLHDQRKDVTPA